MVPFTTVINFFVRLPYLLSIVTSFSVVFICTEVGVPVQSMCTVRAVYLRCLVLQFNDNSGL